MSALTQDQIREIVGQIKPMNAPLNRQLEFGAVGGGFGAFILRHHIRAAELDRRAKLIVGAFGRTPEISRALGHQLGLEPTLCGNPAEVMFEKMSKRLDFVTIATPNNTHAVLATAAAKQGLNVQLDKPLTITNEDADELVSVVEETGVVLGCTFHNTGYPMMILLRAMIEAGELGEIDYVRALYYQGWLREKLEAEEQKQASWRTNASQGGRGGAFGDLGSHAFNLARFVTRVNITDVRGDFNDYVKGRGAYDFGTATCSLENGGQLRVEASQISHGQENQLSIHVDGRRRGADWNQWEPNILRIRENGKPTKIYTCNADVENLGERFPTFAESIRHAPSHPEGWNGAMANHYSGFMDDVIRKTSTIDEEYGGRDTSYQNVYDGREAVYFVNTALDSHDAGGQVLAFDENWRSGRTL